AILAAQIALEKTRKTGRFSTYYVIAHWRVAARLARRVRDGEVPGLVVPYERLVCEPARMMEEVCAYLEIDFDPDIVLTPTKVGQFWRGNSAARINFSQISSEPVLQTVAASLFRCLSAPARALREVHFRHDEAEFPLASQSACKKFDWTLDDSRAADGVPNLFGALRPFNNWTKIKDQHELLFI